MPKYMLLLVLIVAMGGVALAAPVIYYVSPSGDDANTGLSMATAWRSIARVNAAPLDPGNVVKFQGGAAFPGSLLITRSGTAPARIVITSYPTAAGARAEILAGDGDGNVIEDAEYVRVKSLTITGAGIATNRGYGILLNRTLAGPTPLRSIQIDRVETRAFYYTGIAFYGGAVPVGYSGLRVTNADVHDNGYAGLWMGGCNGPPGSYCFKNVYVGYSAFHDNHGIDIPEQTGNGIFFKDVDGGTIEHCLAYNNGDLNRNLTGGPVGIWAIFSNRVIIQFNEAWNNNSKKNDGDGFDFDAGVTNSIMQYNYSHDNYCAGFMLWDWHDIMQSNHNIVRYNISENDSKRPICGGLRIGTAGPGRIMNTQIYGNTIYAGRNNNAPALEIAGGRFSGITIRNNIFMASSGSRVMTNRGGVGVVLQGNAYWNSGPLKIVWRGIGYGTLAAWRLATGQERLGTVETGFEVDPQLDAPGEGGTINDTRNLGSLTAYMLTAASPLIDEGLDLPALGIAPGRWDFYGNAVPQGAGFDVGAHDRGL